MAQSDSAIAISAKLLQLVDLGPVLGSWICGRETLLAFAGEGPINTLDRPLIEFNAPRSLVDRTSEWSRENIHRMLALAENGEQGFAAVFPESSLRQQAKRYRPAVERMMIAHVHKLQGRLSMATDTALQALAHTPEWSYPIGFCNLMLKQTLKEGDDQQFDLLLSRLAADPSVNYWAEYWRARRAMRDQQPFVAQEHLHRAIQAKPQHVPSVNLLRDLQRRFGRGAPGDRH